MKIGYLADHKNVIPILAQWSYDEWSYLHLERSLPDVEQLIRIRSNKETLPLSLVAFDRERVIGMVTLKTHDLESRPQLSPWLAGLYVDKKYRRRGVGEKLVAAIEKEAVRLGTTKLFLYTSDAEQFYLKLSWIVRERTAWKGQTVKVMEKDIVL